ncbi:site-specific DNA-methyltransferase (adenine-specific) [Roseateles sp. YR242]|uniref:DNA methyltransferase n=1 Tax=Roseateles sp. YR242 TaxID=1855305 RepID=UPI0008D3508C|nr:DNA methyltransferase [Roseateles sp. YR242]SEL12914.1 site-specific DNA-methyltransferase (adenine-specific) [Roseateles sp. YR242]
MVETVVIGRATLMLADCMELLPDFTDGFFGLAVTDPPYFDGPNKAGYYGKGYSSLGVPRAKHYDSLESWEIPGAEYFDHLKRVARDQIIWGANHFADRFNSASPGWIVWDKVNGASSFADAELAYCSADAAVRIFRYVWNGMHQGQYGGDKSRNESRIHPTQKPVALYEWCYDRYARAGQMILDTHLGSGSSAIAANNRGFDFVGIEKDPAVFAKACERVAAALQQRQLFEMADQPRPEQADLLRGIAA